jgi:putative ABC transport system permease protein
MAAALYRLLLRLYPSSFRADYEREMTGVFLRRYGRQNTFAARVAFWIETLADVFSNASIVHRDILRQDLRGAARTLTRTPGFSVTVMLVAALGIGATTAAFSLADHVLIRPLPFPQSHRLVRVWQDQSSFGYARMELSPPNFRDWRNQSASFEGMAAFQGGNTLFLPDESGSFVRVDGATTIGDIFGVLQVQPVLGRTINDDDDRPGAPPVILLGDEFWRAHFNADPSIVGRTIAFHDMPRTVVGVMPPGIAFPNRDVKCWTSMRLAAAAYADDQRSNFILHVVARLKPGVTIESARAEMSVIARRLAAAFPATNANTGAVVMALRDDLTPQARMLLWGLVAAAIALLLIACTNLANLLLGKSLATQRELAVRAALGAGRQRLVRQLLTETLTLTVVGGTAGIVLAWGALPFVARLVPTNLPIEDTPALDVRMIAAAIIATLATAAGVGVIPAMRVGRQADASALREGARAGTSRHTERIRSALVVAEIAASIGLLVCTGLLVRALLKIQQTEPGFRADGLVAARLALPTQPQSPYRDATRRLQFYDRVASDVRAFPGVTSAAFISYLPMVMGGGIWPVSVDGNVEDESTAQRASFRQITPQFFATMDTPFTRGRDFDDRDTATSPLVAIVSESFAQRHWPGRDPLGRQITVGGAERTVVGIAGNIRVRGLERTSEPQMYIPAAQGHAYRGYYPRELLVRSSLPPASVTAAIRSVIARVDPQLPISDIRSLRDIVDRQTVPRRVQVNVLASFAAIAFLLAAVGLHGLLSFNVSSRAREIGVRVALGARRQTIVSMILKHALMLSIIGVVLGGALAFAAGRWLETLLAGVSPMDPVTFGGAAVLSLLMTLAGTLLPTLRALRVDPIAVIRTE